MTVPSHISARAPGDLFDSRMPKDSDGHTYFLGLKPGEVASRILLVDSSAMAQRVSKLLDHAKGHFEAASNMGFAAITGKKYGSEISILAIGPGLANMDAAIREIESIARGPLAVMHLGTSSSSLAGTQSGTVVVANRSLALQTNYEARLTDMVEKRFSRSPSLAPDNELRRILNNHLVAYVKSPFSVIEASSITVDTMDAREHAQQLQPDAACVDMKTHYLYDLAHKLSIQAISCSIVRENIRDKKALTAEEYLQIEEIVVKSCIQTLAKLSFNSQI